MMFASSAKPAELIVLLKVIFLNR